MHNQNSSYADTSAIASYAQDAARKVPGLADLHRMVMLLLTETTPSDAEILVVGAGGGLETRGLAEMQSGWRFTGVDLSAPMLDLASRQSRPLPIAFT